MIFGNKDHYEIELGELKIKGVRPVVEGRIVTKVGRVSMRGNCSGREVKIFECANDEHASFVANLMSDGACSRFFPDVYGVHSRFVVTAWVTGKQLTQRDLMRSRTALDQVRDLLDIIHSQTPPTFAGFDYVEDHIRPRFARSCRALGLADFLDRVENSWSAMRGLVDRAYISHPDLSPTNLVVTRDGQVKVVDNELLNVSRAPWFDQMHVVHFIGDTSMRGVRSLLSFLEPLLEITKNGHNGHLLDMWLMRIGGGKFIDGDVRGIVEIAALPKTELFKNAGIWRALRACYPDSDIENLQ
jgi:hypothetical protein